MAHVCLGRARLRPREDFVRKRSIDAPRSRTVASVTGRERCRTSPPRTSLNQPMRLTNSCILGAVRRGVPPRMRPCPRLVGRRVWLEEGPRAASTTCARGPRTIPPTTRSSPTSGTRSGRVPASPCRRGTASSPRTSTFRSRATCAGWRPEVGDGPMTKVGEQGRTKETKRGFLVVSLLSGLSDPEGRSRTWGRTGGDSVEERVDRPRPLRCGQARLATRSYFFRPMRTARAGPRGQGVRRDDQNTAERARGG
jgi:hypothetical protein